MWPDRVERPVRIEIGCDRWGCDRWDFSPEALSRAGYNPVYDDYIVEGPFITVTMSNGAELFIEEVDPDQEHPHVEEFRGDWQIYSQGSNNVINEIIDAVTEIFALARLRAMQ